MLIKKDLKDKRKSIYECDRCKKRTTRDNNVQICIKENQVAKKKWDLCTRCFQALRKGIEKGVQRK